MHRLVAEFGPVKLRPAAETHLGALVRAIVYQQLAGAAAAAIHGRLIAALDGEVTAERLLALPDGTLRAVGLSRNKTASVRDLAAKVLDGTVVLDPRGLRAESDAEVVDRLTHRPGHREMDGGDVPAVPAAAPGRVADRRPGGQEGVRAGVADPDADGEAARAARRPVPAVSFGGGLVLLAGRGSRQCPHPLTRPGA